MSKWTAISIAIILLVPLATMAKEPNKKDAITELEARIALLENSIGAGGGWVLKDATGSIVDAAVVDIEVDQRGTLAEVLMPSGVGDTKILIDIPRPLCSQCLPRPFYFPAQWEWGRGYTSSDCSGDAYQSGPPLDPRLNSLIIASDREQNPPYYRRDFSPTPVQEICSGRDDDSSECIEHDPCIPKELFSRDLHRLIPYEWPVLNGPFTLEPAE